MNITVSEESKIKRLSLERKLPFANMLRGYMVDDLLWRIYTSDYKDYLWLLNIEAVGIKAYEKNREDSLRMIYRKSDKKFFEEELQAGQKLSRELLVHLVEKVLLPGNSAGVTWEGSVEEEEEGYTINMVGSYENMRVPVRILVTTLTDSDAFANKELMEVVCNSYPITVYTYSIENALCQSIHEILYKLELIGDMEAYHIVNSAIKNQSISGRRVVEQLEEIHPRDAKFYVEKRLQQIEGYKNYAYMRKRWEQYEKKKGCAAESWEQVIERLLKFLGPIWTAMCKKEVFFDDWMPELERYLG